MDILERLQRLPLISLHHRMIVNHPVSSSVGSCTLLQSSTIHQPKPPSPPSPDEIPINVKQAYKTFAAVPLSHPLLEIQELPGQTSTEKPKTALEVPMSSGLHSPEQRPFRERQKYFEVEVKQQQMDKPPRRVSLVGEDDPKKMKEEEAQKLQQKHTLLLEEEVEEDEMIKRVPEVSMQSSVITEGVEYKIERLNGRSIQPPGTRPPVVTPWHLQKWSRNKEADADKYSER
nr:protein scribble homolog isoform X2 [Anser cygnoides]